ncbi:unnamed protein product [Heligmosomoides polygyrus]|uniref:SLC26A/SulP transporter domain-containing protein n=1 Tax=Heligmosomoides polygyrus TaxID=6339 RepID=A0A3P8FST2_HELPZ|nr:unnamed protein product [Heligmosomoides polygyrus]
MFSQREKFAFRLPAPHIPLLEPVLVKHLIVPAAGIAVVAYAVTVSMGKLFARKHKYEIDTDQEMLALGLAGSISSFFSVFPSSTSLSRSLVNEGAGARTQVSGFVAASVVLCVILVIAPLLEALPMCVLNSIVVVALSSLIAKVTELRTLWRFSKLDVVGICSLTIAFSCFQVGKSGYRSVVSYSQAKRTTIPIVRFDSPVIFTNVELLKSYVRRVVENETGNVLIWLCGRFFNSTSLCICHKENMRTQTAHAFGQFMGLSRAKLILIKFIDVRSTSTSVCK